jgi:predicted alpha/beta hydrolase
MTAEGARRMTTQPVEPTRVSLTAGDGFRLGALRYPARGPVRARLVVAGATGVPQGFYRAFASFAAERGYETLTLDYRGIGLSRPARMRGFEARLEDWARHDLGAAVDAMASDALPLFMVGHSFGGHAFGLLPNHRRVARFYTFGTGAGWHGWMPPGERLKVLLLWRIGGPLLTSAMGYLAWSALGMGEDLPLGVYRDWRRWCRFPRYFFDDATMAHVRGLFGEVTTPIIAANATDDVWALPASRDAFMSGYPSGAWAPVDIEPHRRGMGSIGHMGYFRRPARPLWDEALAFFAEHRAPAPEEALR